jgi:hypothetical protein
VGGVLVWRLSTSAALGFVVWVVVIVGFHLPYAALRLRDVLSVFPPLAALAGIGLVGCLAPRLAAGSVPRGVAAAGVVLLLWVRTAPTLRDTAPGVTYSTFGYLRAEQRGAFDTLADLTPADAVIAASLNSGAIGLYAKRDAVRPAAWDQPGDWEKFLARMQELDRPVFVLADGDELQGPQEAADRRYGLTPVATLPLPYFFPDAGSEGRQITLFQVRLSEDKRAAGRR